MRIPFSGKGCNIRCEDIMEGDPKLYLPTRVSILDFDIATSKEMDNDHFIHNREINNFEINDGENLGDDRVQGDKNALHYAPDEEVEENEPQKEEDMLVPHIMRVNILVEQREPNHHHNFHHGF